MPVAQRRKLGRVLCATMASSVWLTLQAGTALAHQVRLPIVAQPGERVGSSVALDDGRIVVAAPGRAGAGQEGRGRVLILRQRVDRWVVANTLRAADAGSVTLGAKVAIDGTTVAVGDFDYSRPVPQAGIVRLFDTASAGVPQQTLAVEESAIATLFGGSVDVSGDLLVVGAPGAHVDGLRSGAAYVYRRRGADWELVQRLTSPRPVFNAFFGVVRIVDDRILVGSRNEPASAAGSGAVLVFVRRPGTSRWELKQTLVAPGAPADATFGVVLAARGDALAVGARGANGAFVNLFGWDGAAYRHQQRVRIAGLAPEAGFGTSLALTDEFLLVGAPNDTRTAIASGGVYVFRRGSAPDERYRLAAFLGSPSGGAGDQFGASLAARGERMVVGAPGADGSGAAFLYDLKAVADPPALFDPLAPNVLPRASVRAMLQDELGFLWLGADDSLIIYDGYGARRYTYDAADPTSLPAGLVLSMLRDRSNRYWIGTEHGLARFDPVAEIFQRYPVPADDHPRTSFVALFQDRSGVVWTGTNGRLYRYFPEDDRFAAVLLGADEPRTIDEAYISGIQEDAGGRLWVLAKSLWENRASLYRLGRDRTDTVRYPLDPRWGQVGPFAIDSADRFWIKAPGPAVVPDVPGEAIEPAVRPSAEVHWTFHEDRRQELWIGVDRGYFHRSVEAELTGPLRQAGAGIAELKVLSFLTTGDGSLLAGTSVGVYRRLPLAGTQGRQRQAGQHAEPVPGAGAGVLGAAQPVSVVLRDVEIFGRDGPRKTQTEGLGRVTLLPADFRLTVEYSAPAFTDPDRTRYRYRLRDYDRTWVDAGDRPFALYANVPPGEYAFEARATVVDGRGEVVEALPLLLDVQVVAPFWQRGWFRALLGLAVAGVLAVGLQLRRRQRRYVAGIRRQIAADLHDDLSTNLSGIALASRMLARNQALEEPERDALGRIVNAADEMAGDLRDIVWLVDPGRDTADDVADKMRDVAAALLGTIPFELDRR